MLCSNTFKNQLKKNGSSKDVFRLMVKSRKCDDQTDNHNLMLTGFELEFSG